MDKKSTPEVTKQTIEKRINMIANGFMFFSGAWLVTTLVALTESTIALNLMLGIEAVLFSLQCLLAIGLLRRNKIAYYASILFGIMTIIFGVLSVPTLLGYGMYILYGLAVAIFGGIVTLLWFLSFIVSFVLWIYLLFPLNSKLGKVVFQIK